MAGEAMMYAGASAGLDILSGLFGYFTAQEAAATAESRGRMIRLEAEADATRYKEQATAIHAQTKLAYLKSGVELSGSPLDVLDRDVLTAQENISAIRAKGAAGQMDAESQAAGAMATGRGALLSGVTGGFGKLAWASYQDKKSTTTSTTNRKDVPTGSRMGSSAWLSAEGWQ